MPAYPAMGQLATYSRIPLPSLPKTDITASSMLSAFARLPAAVRAFHTSQARVLRI